MEKCSKCGKVIGEDGIGSEIIFKPIGEYREATFKLCSRCAYIYRIATAKWLEAKERSGGEDGV